MTPTACDRGPARTPGGRCARSRARGRASCRGRDRSPAAPARLLALAEVDAAGQLADDEQVDAVEQLRPERRRGHERRVDRDRAQVGVQPEPAAQGEQRLLRADRRRRVGPLRTADGAEQDGVGRPARLDVLGSDGDAVGVDGDAAGEDLRPVDREPEPLCRRRRRPAAPPRRPRARPRRPGSWRCDSAGRSLSVVASREALLGARRSRTPPRRR